MKNTFRNKYRIASARLHNWDYTNAAAYFITICTKEKDSYFGEIANHKMTLSKAAIIADMLWCEIKNHTQNVELGAYVVMPNHIHGILILNGMGSNDSKQRYEECGQDANDERNAPNERNAKHVETLHATSLPRGAITTPLIPPPPPIEKNEFMSSISPKSNSIATIIRSYKSAVTKHCNRLDIEFGWQPRFYDHIIRDAKSFENIEHYIENNIRNWKEDRFYEKG